MIDSLVSAVLISVLGTASFLDPNPITPQNEMQLEFEQRAQYALDHYSEFGKLDERGVTYVRLGPPVRVERDLKVKANLDLSLSMGKQAELVPTETWFYGHLNKPLIFQERESGGFYLPRQPDQLVVFTSQIQSKINYTYFYDKESLHTIYATVTNNLKDCPDSVEFEMFLFLDAQDVVDSGYTWQVAIQDRNGVIVKRDSLVRLLAVERPFSISQSPQAGTGQIIDHLSLILAKETFQGNTLTAHTYSVTTEVCSGKKGNLQIWR